MTIHHHDTLERHADTSAPDPHQDTYSKTTLGFWIYLMTDCILFATLFATYAILRPSTFGGPSPGDLFSLPLAFTQTMLLLCSSVACGLSLLAAKNNASSKSILWLSLCFILGAAFIALEIAEFRHLVHEGNGWQRSAFLSSFFALVTTHGLHVTVGLFWILVMIGQLCISGITLATFRRLALFGMFWHFLDLIWIFIFTFVYLMRVA